MYFTKIPICWLVRKNCWSLKYKWAEPCFQTTIRHFVCWIRRHLYHKINSIVDILFSCFSLFVFLRWSNGIVWRFCFVLKFVNIFGNWYCRFDLIWFNVFRLIFHCHSSVLSKSFPTLLAYRRFIILIEFFFHFVLRVSHQFHTVA